MTRRALIAAVVVPVLAVVALVVVLAGDGPGGPARELPRSGPVVLVGAGGLSWSDVSPSATPTLWSVLDGGSVAAMNIRSVHPNTCPLDGWLSLSAGNRAGQRDQDGASRPPCQALPEPQRSAGGADVPGWSNLLRIADRQRFDAQPGLLGQRLADAGRCVTAIGPGAALAAADRSGHVADYTDRTEPAAFTRCPVSVVDLGAVRDPDEVDPSDAVRDERARAGQVAALDARLAQVLAALPDDARVLVAGLSDSGAHETLRAVAAVGPGVPAGVLASGSTRHRGLVQLADLTATLLDQAGAPRSAQVQGAPLLAVRTGAGTATERLHLVRDQEQAAEEIHGAVPIFFNGWVVAQLVIYLCAAIVWRRQRISTRQRARLLRGVRLVASVAAAIPVSTFLANLLPWWRAPVPVLALTGSVLAFTALVAGWALLGPLRHQRFGLLGVVCGATAVTLAVDVLTGSRLQISSLMGLQPVVGGRFYGMGNVTFALFATATLLCCAVLADRLVTAGRARTAAALVLVLGLAAVAVDGSTSWGSDFGGPPALIAGLAYLVLGVLGLRLTWRRALAVFAGIVGFVVLVGLLDWRRPVEQQSHLGRFVQSVVDGGAGDVVLRKAEQNLSILTSNWMTVLVPVAFVVMVWVLARPTAWGASSLDRVYASAPMLRRGVVAICVTLVIGFLINDSGVAMPAIGATLLLPLMIALSVRSLERDG